MVDKIVKFKNDKEYLIMDETNLDDKTYYFGVRVLEDDVPTSEYLLFEKIDKDNEIILNPIRDDELKGLLLTTFTVNYLNMTYEEEGV